MFNQLEKKSIKKKSLTESKVQTDGMPLRVNDARSLPNVFDAWHV